MANLSARSVNEAVRVNLQNTSIRMSRLIPNLQKRIKSSTASKKIPTTTTDTGERTMEEEYEYEIESIDDLLNELNDELFNDIEYDDLAFEVELDYTTQS